MGTSDKRRLLLAGAAGAVAIVIAALVLSGLGGSTGPVGEDKTSATDGAEQDDERPKDAGCPKEGPWADQDCPEAAWARSVVEKAGYENVGDTGSALQVSTNEGSLYLWTSPIKERADPGRKEANKGGYAPRGEIQGNQVYGGQTKWVWDVHQLHVWAESTGKADLQLEVLRPLVRASSEIPFRG